MKKLLYLFVLALTFTACSTDDDANVPDGLLKRVKFNDFVVEDSHTDRYYYEGYKLDRIESSNNKREIYYYAGDLIVNIKNYEDTNLVREQQFQYDTAGKLVQKHVIYYQNDWNEKSVYTYNNDATVTENRMTYHNGMPETLYFTRQFFFAGNEVSQDIITYAETGNTATTTYTYDDKLVPEHGIKGFDKIRMFNPSGYKGIYNNIVTVYQTYSNSGEIGTYSHLWQYNQQGAPAAFMYDDQGTVVIDAGSVEYFYK